MKYIVGKNRSQMEFYSLEELISQDNEVRLIDLFVDSLPLSNFGFEAPKQNEQGGRPAYHPSDLLKLFIYGYLNRIRSSKQLEKECVRNLEVKWLMRELVPDHNTISNFRRDNPRAIKKVFRSTVELAKNFELIGGKLLAGDGTKLRAQNSKKNNFNQKKIDRHLAYIEAKLEEYNAILAQEDGDAEQKTNAQKKIEEHLLHKQKYHDLEKQLEESGEVQISTSDPDSRQLIIRNYITEVAYNVQSTVDAKHNLPINFEVTNDNDSKAMGNMLEQAVEVLGHNEFTALFDKGYHTGSEFVKADELGVEVIVAVPDIPTSSMAPDPAYNVSNFVYNKASNTFTCPQGETLVSNGKWYQKSRNHDGRKRQESIAMQQYKTSACKTCAVYERCTKAPKNRGRVIERTAYAHLLEENKQRAKEQYAIYQQRQAIVEHPFGIIKRQWDFSYILTKRGKERASADVGLIFSAFNLRRIFTILDQNLLKKFLRELDFFFSILRSYLKRFTATFSTKTDIFLLKIYLHNAP
ncbi:MAG: IS1182 family transposase [Crocinitomicaceae bacterium]|nr:IS1182 family transposase [Crocinitomicaceae bacterium]